MANAVREADRTKKGRVEHCALIQKAATQTVGSPPSSSRGGPILAEDMAAIIVGAAIAFVKIMDVVKDDNYLVSDDVLVLFANNLSHLGRLAPQTKVEEVYALAAQFLMQTESTVETCT